MSMSTLRSGCLALAGLLLAGGEHDPLPGSGGSAFDPTPYLGDWNGTWTNLTTTTSGSATFAVALQSAEVLQLTVDLGGNVFGAGDPPSQVFLLSVQETAATLTAQSSPTFGQVDARLEADGFVSATASEVPVGNVRSLALEGQWLENEIDLDVTITYAPGSSPETARALLRLTRS
jgi:hypothetical protein